MFAKNMSCCLGLVLAIVTSVSAQEIPNEDPNAPQIMPLPIVQNLAEGHVPYDVLIQDQAVLEHIVEESLPAPVVHYEQPNSISFYETNSENVGQLLVSNVPYGIWIEIEDSMYRHRDKTGMSRIAVSGFNASASSGSQSLILSTARSPEGFNDPSTMRSANISLSLNQTVEFDWTRVFGNDPFSKSIEPEKPLVPVLAASAKIRSKPVPVKSISPAPVTPVAPVAKPHADPLDSLEFAQLQLNSTLVAQVDMANEANAVDVVEITGTKPVELFRLTGKEDLLRALDSKVTFVGKSCKLQFTSLLGKIETIDIKEFGVELTLTKSSVAGEKFIAVNLSKESLKAAIEKNKTASEMIKELAPVTKESVEAKILFDTDAEIQFENKLLPKGDPAKVKVKLLDANVPVSLPISITRKP